MKIYENNQEVFDAVWAHINMQGRGCYKGPGCLYFNEEDWTSCAIGGILPPEVDRKKLDLDERFSSIDGIMWRSDTENARRVQEVFKNVDVDFLFALQTLHDSTLKWEGLKNWKEKMLELADQRGLKKP